MGISSGIGAGTSYKDLERLGFHLIHIMNELRTMPEAVAY
jgi:hypothetical protein